MKNMKKLFALVLAIVMVMSLAVTASAVNTESDPNTTKHTITINAGDSGAKDGHTYEAYQILRGDYDATTGTLSNITWGTGVTDGAALLTALKQDATIGSKFADDETAADVAETLKAFGDKSSELYAFAEVVEDYLNTSKKFTSTETKAPYTVDVEGDGYYLIKDGDTVPDQDAFTKYILTVVGDVTVETKVEIPTIEKKILEGTAKVDANNAGVGKVVSYEIIGNVPDHSDYDTYFYVINDTLSAGLTFNNDITVTVGGKTLTAGTDYYVYTGDGYTFRVAFANIKNYTAGSAIVVNYSATVNSSAVIGSTGNPNTVNLTYSNNPNSDEKGESKPGIPDSKVPTGTTPDDITITYVAQIEITKTKDNGTAVLPGAEFTLTGTSKETVLINRTYYVEDADGTYYLLKDGTYTTDDPTAEGMDTSKYVSTTTKYKQQTVTETKIVEVPVTMVGTSDANGKIVFSGLGEGTYTIEETGVPTGYNKAENVTIVIECTEPTTVSTGKETATWAVGTGSTSTVTVDGTIAMYKVSIDNKSGTTLPSTGGMGTTLFYVVGAVLVLAAVVLLVTKKRMNTAE